MFAHASFLVIFLNTVFVWHVTDFCAANLVQEPNWMKRVELIFLLYYSVEVILKWIVHKKWFFCGSDWMWNVFDFLIVLVGLVQVVLDTFFTDARQVDITFLRVLRVLRITKILRIFKTLRFLPELRLMANCIAGSLGSLFWATLFLTLMLMITALVFVQSMSNFQIENPDCKHELCPQVHQMFGSVISAMIVLLETTTGGCDWSEVYEVMHLTGPLNSFLFIAYIIFFTFAFFNIVMSIFVDKAMKLAKPDEEQSYKQRVREEAETTKEITALLVDTVDKDHSGTITMGELQEAFEVGRVRHKFEQQDITVREAEVFFQTVTTMLGRDELTIDEFVRACMKMKGPASSIDLQAIGFQVEEMSRNIEALSLYDEVRCARTKSCDA